MSLLTFSAAILAGFIGLIWSADRFVAGAAAIARSLGMAPILIGLTIVSLGTSAPEIIVSIQAAISGSSSLAVGNAIGSNLANIGMVLGITALLVPIPVQRLTAVRELPIVLAVTVGAGFCLYDGALNRIEGCLLLIALITVLYRLTTSKAHQPDVEEVADVEHLPDPMPPHKAWLLFIVGLLLLVGSADLLVWGAQGIATAWGVSELVIGLTVVAVGTSLPELAATAASALKGHHDIALGNVLGSNLFNLLAVMPMPALIRPATLGSDVFFRDYLSMLGITVLLATLITVGFLRSKSASTNEANTVHIGRLAGLLLLFSYAAYYYFLFAQ